MIIVPKIYGILLAALALMALSVVAWRAIAEHKRKMRSMCIYFRMRDPEIGITLNTLLAEGYRIEVLIPAKKGHRIPGASLYGPLLYAHKPSHVYPPNIYRGFYMIATTRLGSLDMSECDKWYAPSSGAVGLGLAYEKYLQEKGLL